MTETESSRDSSGSEPTNETKLCLNKTGNGKAEKATRCTIRKSLVWFPMAALATSSIFTVATVAITITIMTQPPPEKLQSLCVECAQLNRTSSTQPQVDLVSKLRRRHENDRELCCAGNQEQMSALLEAITRERENDSATNAQVSHAKVAPVSAHKQLHPVEDYELNLTEPYFNGGMGHFPATFHKDDSVTEHVRGIEVLDKALRINYTGLYFVYCGIHFAPKYKTLAKNFQYKSWYTYVYRDRQGIPTDTDKLLQIAYSAPADSIDAEETAFASGTFLLNKGDHLEVCVSALGLYQYNKESSFLGVFMLKSGSHDS